MVRQRPRKSVEELYATKFEANPLKSQVNSNNQSKNSRTVERDRDYNNYVITSSTPYNTNCTGGGTAGGGSASAAPAHMNALSASMATGRRKSARPPNPQVKPEKYFTKDEKLLNLDDVKKDHNSKAKTSRPEKSYNMYNSQNAYDNKNYMSYTESTQKDVQPHPHLGMQSQHHHHHHVAHDDDKDDDTEEFFGLIRQTVENAIGKSISDLLNRNFRELSAKVDRFSAELKSTNSLLNKLQTELTNKVIHYGEENSRHFRYLCMKSEYDKMFYQHHTMLASSPPTPPNQPGSQQPVAEKPPRPPQKPNNMPSECDKSQNSCSCRTQKTLADPHKVSSEDRSMSNKSSEMGMREVLEHIQRFCTQMQLSDLKCDEPMSKAGGFRLEEAMKINKQVFDEDDDDFQMSSDGMTPRSDEHIPAHNGKYVNGGTTMRSCSTTRGNNGGGDA